ncbi:Plug domain-containing protein [Parabacteroides sp. PF5-9]|uniref:Plug domain-containing protein n=1 Tax=Parabacteroides sp. PF5-9 TaxID=1742404 RepID=UPI002475097D|nr:Plug domain-containing protein [Parabacteroides sp. PF5-9]
MKRPFLFLLLVISTIPLFAQEKTHSFEKRVQENILQQLTQYPQEKIHLHLDRDYYVPGERIWFKAYLTDAATHRSPGVSRYIYVELLNSSNELINRVMLRPEKEMYYGHIFLSEAVPEDYYTIRAYTSYMNNPNNDYFFKKQIRIGSITEQQSTSSNTGKRKQSGNFEVSFFPEGGNLLEGTLCKVAFKALNVDGSSAYVSGNVTDEEGHVLTSLKTLHAGMGVFGFIPEKGKTYYANCTDLNGKNRRFRLPEAKSNTYSLTVMHGRNGRLLVGRQKPTNEPHYASSYLVIHCRGIVLYAGTWDTSKDFLVFRENEFPSGVIQLLLLDEQMNPLSERLIFCRNDDQAQLSFSTDKENYAIRDLVRSELTVTDLNGLPLTGNYSISVTDDKDQAVDYSSSILSTLLLTSELKGYIESPGSYFQNKDEKSVQLLDCLMLTHGWRRYDIPEVIKGNIEHPPYKPETSLAVSGRVTTLLTARPVKNSPINMMTMSTGETFETITSEDGRFIFDGFEFPDSTKFFLRAENNKGRTSVELRMDEKQYPPLQALAFEPSPTNSTDNQPKETEEVTGTFIEKASERYKFDDEMRIVHLQDVEIVGRKQNKDPEPFSIFSKLADTSVGLTELKEKNPVTMLDAFSSIPGLTPAIIGENPNDISLLFYGHTPAAIFINDVYMDPEMGAPLSMIGVQDIERIDVFKPGAGSGIYGLLGVDGVVNITTKRGTTLSDNNKEVYHQKTITPLGYQKPVEFYSPRYETQEQKFDITPDLRTTIFWKPDLVTGTDGKAAFDFYTSDFNTTYSVVIEGLTHDGRIVRDVKKIQVK